ncbi:Transposon TX1 uncharacterized protein [Merluccius polli]|uniref:Transposon TX1 uncharacterized protein n=1 Tax=Merluccius polli TaxID=89951 RepID=A0AA47NC18_MERPO|nr:Transposon TX1 uncharacterized protein [Merluccius polli]
MVVLNTQADIKVLEGNVELFNRLSSSKVNWNKSEAFITKKDSLNGLVLPGGLSWKVGGLKYLGVFLGDELCTKRNWEGVLESIEGRLKRWRWLLPSMSFRGRTLIINNLVSSSLWHRLAVVDPPSNLLSCVQSIMVNFFWDKLHWLPQAVLFLPKEEGGQGLVHLASKCAAFRLQFIQRLLYGPQDLVWRPLARLVLRSVGGLGLQESVFLMDFKTVKFLTLPVFYRGLLSVWKLLWRKRIHHESLFWLLKEPLGPGGLLGAPQWAGVAVAEALRKAGITSLGAVVEYAGTDLQETTGLAAVLGWRSRRIIGQLLDHWRAGLTGQEWRLLGDYSHGFTAPCSDDPFPSLTICPSSDQQGEVSLKGAKGKDLSMLMVRRLNSQKLQRRSQLPWRAHLALGEEVRPQWRSLYKPPLSKRVADLQWRLLHGILAVNAFINILNSAVPKTCPFCGAAETVFHCFMECPRLVPLFNLLDCLFRKVGEVFSIRTIILGFKYKKNQKDKCQLTNFILGQSKMAVYVSRKRKVEDNLNVDILLLLSRMVKARIIIDFKYYKAMQDLELFKTTWTYGDTMVNGVTFDHLTRKHGIKITASFPCSVEDIGLAVGEKVGHGSVKSAARMNSTVVIFLDQVEKVNRVVETGITVKEMFVQVVPLTQPFTRVILSNVPPFITDEFLSRELSRHGKFRFAAAVSDLEHGRVSINNVHGVGENDQGGEVLGDVVEGEVGEVLGDAVEGEVGEVLGDAVEGEVGEVLGDAVEGEVGEETAGDSVSEVQVNKVVSEAQEGMSEEEDETQAEGTGMGGSKPTWGEQVEEAEVEEAEMEEEEEEAVKAKPASKRRRKTRGMKSEAKSSKVEEEDRQTGRGQMEESESDESISDSSDISGFKITKSQQKKLYSVEMIVVFSTNKKC